MFKESFERELHFYVNQTIYILLILIVNERQFSCILIHIHVFYTVASYFSLNA
jgi:hypothetical protein